MIAWGDLNARAAGLGTHLLGRGRLEDLLRCADLATLAAAFSSLREMIW